MISYRPKASPHHLERRRLLDHLPDDPGYVVWFEAPYGYGKSVLASQWADLLESGGWRVIWTAAQGREPKQLVAQELGLPRTAPWGALLEALWGEPTLLVVEDLETPDEHEGAPPPEGAPRARAAGQPRPPDLLRAAQAYDHRPAGAPHGRVSPVQRVGSDRPALGLSLEVLESERNELRTLVVSFLHEASAEGPAERSTALLTRVLELDPLHEEALQELLKGLLKRGRRQEAVRRYQEFERRLQDEMGLEPLEETAALFKQIG